MITHLDLFSGIGGFAYAVDQVWPDAEHIFCEIDPFCQEVLRKHWPNSKIYGDIRTITDTTSFRSGGSASQERPTDKRKLESSERQGSEVRGESERRVGIDLLTGGFPCQPFSQAGRRGGTSDDRFLWPEMLRVIQLTQPTWVIAENVRGLLTIEQGVVFEQVCLDLEASGYEVQPFIIPAVSVNAPHRRDRVWFIAHAKGGNDRGELRSLPSKNETQSESQELHQNEAWKLSDAGGDDADTGNLGLERRQSEDTGHGGQLSGNGGDQGWDWNQNWLEVATKFCVLDDGLPDRVAKLKALGNAIVPAVAVELLKAIKLSYQ